MEAELPPGDENFQQLKDGQFKMPSIDKILEALENMDLSDEKKEEIKQNVLSGKFGENLGKLPQAAGNVIANSVTVDILIVLGLFAVVFLVIVFFGYKLYRSLNERERRKEEKRRQKQQKKKK